MEVRMNAELPAFDPNQVDAAFAEALEEDGLPPLYPNQPRWACLLYTSDAADE